MSRETADEWAQKARSRLCTAHGFLVEAAAFYDAHGWSETADRMRWMAGLIAEVITGPTEGGSR